jgi:CHAT domain-containing protein/tetratricopeptide (TPR) repeat protein
VLTGIRLLWLLASLGWLASPCGHAADAQELPEAGTSGFPPASELPVPASPATGQSAGMANPTQALDDRLRALVLAADYAGADRVVRRSLHSAAWRHGRDSVPVANILSWHAYLSAGEGRYSASLAGFRRVLAIYQQRLGANDPLLTSGLNNVAYQLMNLRRLDEAEPLFLRALELRESEVKPDLNAITGSITNLATLYRQQGRSAEAEPLLMRALRLREQIAPEGSLGVAASLGNLALHYHAIGRYQDAQPLLTRALELRRRLQPPNHPDIAGALTNLAQNHTLQDRVEVAQPLLEQALEIRAEIHPADHPHVAASANNLALNDLLQGKHERAEYLLQTALEALQTSLPREHPQVTATLRNLAEVYYDSRRPAEALATIRLASASVLEREAFDPGLQRRHVAIAWFNVRQGLASLSQVFDETIKAGQHAQRSRASDAVARMAARSSANSGPLAELIRRRESLEEERAVSERQLSAALALPREQRQGRDVKARQALSEISGATVAIDQRLRAEHAEYFELVKPAALDRAAIRALLRDDEALLVLSVAPRAYPAPEATYVWVVTRTEESWVRSPLGPEALGRELAAVRCGLEIALWRDATGWPKATEPQKRERARQMTQRQSCLELLGPQAEPPTDGLPRFDLRRAHTLYRSLLGEVEGLIKGKNLLIVATGILTQLPFHVLVTAEPKSDEYADAAWLGRAMPAVVLPSVASLQALRRHTRPSRASKAYFAVANPLLTGRPEHTAAAALAVARKTCADVPVPLGSGQRSAPVDVEEVKALAPLPETAEEVCQIARWLGAGEPDVRLGSRASEAAIKALSGSGGLADYRVLHFATHGLVAGDLRQLTEPALVLTPSIDVSETDDGLLKASEVAGLKIDADWVILSACNTAAGNSRDAEALSGLGRAFFYAGARTLLVSHWEVFSTAAVELVTGAFEAQRRTPGVGRAEAMRQAMTASIARGGFYAHPAYWAPFVVVGEGAADR